MHSLICFITSSSSSWFSSVTTGIGLERTYTVHIETQSNGITYGKLYQTQTQKLIGMDLLIETFWNGPTHRNILEQTYKQKLIGTDLHIEKYWNRPTHRNLQEWTYTQKHFGTDLHIETNRNGPTHRNILEQTYTQKLI